MSYNILAEALAEANRAELYAKVPHRYSTVQHPRGGTRGGEPRRALRQGASQYAKVPQRYCNMTLIYGSSCANNGKGALNTRRPHRRTASSSAIGCLG
eukprot:8079998-Pyramimonas_sp.AAC.1